MNAATPPLRVLARVRGCVLVGTRILTIRFPLSQCIGKRRFFDRAHAEGAAERMALVRGESFRVYVCEICDGHHVTGHGSRRRVTRSNHIPEYEESNVVRNQTG